MKSCVAERNGAYPRMLFFQKSFLILIKSDSWIKMPSLAGFRSTPPIFTSRLSAAGVIRRFALPVRNSWLSLSPISVATEIMAVVMLMPRVMASTANALRRTWRRKDSNKRRANIRLLGEHSNLPGKIGARDNYGAGFSLAVFLLNRLQRN